MSGSFLAHHQKFVTRPEGLEHMIGYLKREAYRTIGPKIENGAVVLNEIHAVSDLPVGWRDVRDCGRYCLERTDGDLLFSHGPAVHPWKKYLSPPKVRIWQGRRHDGGTPIAEGPQSDPPYAFFGVRPCDLHAIGLLDRVFGSSEFVDPVYAPRRRQAFIVAVNCTLPGATCFCAAMHTGPQASAGFDVVLTEVHEPPRHYLVAAAGSTRGQKLLAAMDYGRAAEKEVSEAKRAVAQAAARMDRSFDPSRLESIFPAGFDHPGWDEPAEKCLSCGNCTMVCPTCFCHTIEDSISPAGDHAERWRRWDSCFTREFSHMHGGSVRSSVRSRYRHWLTHKFSTWVAQFGAAGCVGCSRCITWCPAGMDIRREANAVLREAKVPALTP